MGNPFLWLPAISRPCNPIVSSTETCVFLAMLRCIRKVLRPICKIDLIHFINMHIMPFAITLKMELWCMLVPLTILDVSSNLLKSSLSQLIGHDLERHNCPHTVPQLTAPEHPVSKFLLHWWSPRTQWNTPIWRKFGTTKIRAGHPAKLRNQARMAMVREATSNPIQRSSVEVGEPFGRTTICAFPHQSGLRGSDQMDATPIKGTVSPLSLSKCISRTLRSWEQDSLVWFKLRLNSLTWLPSITSEGNKAPLIT